MRSAGRRGASLLRLFTAGDPVVAAVALLVVAYYCATPGIFQGKASGDGWFGFLYLPGAIYHHTLDLAPTAPQYVPILGREVTGRVANACPIGPDLIWLPFYLVGLALKAGASLFVKLPSESLPGQTPFDYWMAGLGGLLAGLAGVAIQFRLLARRLSVPAARFATVASVLATPLLWYLTIQPLYQHACAFLFVTLLIERWDAWRDELTARRAIALGLLGGGAMTMRLQEAVFLLLPIATLAAEALGALRRSDGRSLARAITRGLLLGAAALLAFAPQLALWIYFFGKVRPPQPPGHMRWLDPAVVAMLFSTRGGLLPWTPIYYLVLPGLALARRRLGGLAMICALMIVVEVWVNAAAWDFFGSFTFGARRFSEATLLFAVGLGGIWHRAVEARRAGWHRAIAVACALAIGWNGLLMELMRRGKIKSSGAGAWPASTWVRWAKGPAWLGALFDRVGYPFCQPAGWIYALVYRVPVRSFEGVVGIYVMERDSRIHAAITRPSVELADPGELVPEGIAGPPGPGGAVPVAARVRILVPMFAREPVRARLVGSFGGREREVALRWNGQPLAPSQRRDGLVYEVPVGLVHDRSRTNVVEIDAPPGSSITRLALESTTAWW